MAKDQRYCLQCGHRRGDPRLPFMDAVVFMEASRQPEAAVEAAPAPKEARPRISNNSVLVAGVATLVLAIGVGVLIGRSGDSGTQTVANTTPQVIKVEGGGGGTETESATETSESKSGKGGSGGKKKDSKAAEKLETGSSGTTKAAEEVLKPSANAKPLPPPTTQVGEKCEKGTAGCSESGEFDGSFFE